MRACVCLFEKPVSWQTHASTDTDAEIAPQQAWIWRSSSSAEIQVV
jgi:hypothetical protein